MPTRNINLTDRFDRFVEEGVVSGRYKNASEVVRAGLRLLERQEREDALKLERLRDAVRLGFEDAEAGNYIELGGEDEIEAYVKRLGQQARASVRQRGL